MATTTSKITKKSHSYTSPNPKEFSKQTKKEIIKAREEIKKGEFTTLSKLKRKYKIRF